MSDPSLALQAAIVAALRNLGTAAGGNVYDTVPASDPFPRITVGPGQSVPLELDCMDASEVTMQVDVWSRSVGYPEVKTIAGAVRDRLHNGSLTVAGHVVDLLKVESAVFDRDPDGSTSRARMSVRAQTQPA